MDLDESQVEIDEVYIIGVLPQWILTFLLGLFAAPPG